MAPLGYRAIIQIIPSVMHGWHSVIFITFRLHACTITYPLVKIFTSWWPLVNFSSAVRRDLPLLWLTYRVFCSDQVTCYGHFRCSTLLFRFVLNASPRLGQTRLLYCGHWGTWGVYIWGESVSRIVDHNALLGTKSKTNGELKYLYGDSLCPTLRGQATVSP